MSATQVLLCCGRLINPRLLGAQDIGAVVERAAQANLLTAAAKRVLLDRQATGQVQTVDEPYN